MRSRSARSLALAAVGLCVAARTLGSTAAAPADQENIVYPPGANVLDVTKPPYNAKGDGKTDDTQALIQCIDDARARKNICYLPDNTYLVSDTLTYKVSVKDPKYKVEANQYVRIQGQSQRGVVIRLKDNLGFAGPVLSTIKDGNSNIAFANRVANLTVDTGAGNPAAIGIRFSASNGGAFRHVTIKSGDGAGFRGLDIVAQTGPTYLHHLSISGFDTGIFLPYANVFFEHVTLNRQNKAGIVSNAACASFRKILSNNAVPVLVNLGDGQSVLLDSELNGGSDALPALLNPGADGHQAYLLVRNVRTRGYTNAINNKGENIAGADVVEYSSHGVQKLWAETPGRTLNLPIKETPNVAWSADPTDWAFVNEYGAVGDGQADDTAAIQKAMNAGKPIVFFPPGKKYKVTKTITIGGAVGRVLFNYALFDNIPLTFDQPLFKVVDGAAPVVLLEEFQNDFEYYTVVEHATKRTLVLREFWIRRGAAYRNSVTGGEVFIENIPAGVKGAKGSVPYEFTFKDQKVWARNINPEHHYHILNDGSLFWAFGFKSEADAAVFTTINGGLTEILGGNKWSGGRVTGRPEEPCLISVDSHVSASLFEKSGGSKPNPIAVPIRETRNGVTRTLAAADLPRRTQGPGFVLPLYVGYDRAAVDALLRDKFKMEAK